MANGTHEKQSSLKVIIMYVHTSYINLSEILEYLNILWN